MRVKLQLVLCSEDGREETVTDIVSLNKDSHRIEHLGLTLAESKQLLKRIQKQLLEQQIGSPGVIAGKFTLSTPGNMRAP